MTSLASPFLFWRWPVAWLWALSLSAVAGSARAAPTAEDNCAATGGICPLGDLSEAAAPSKRGEADSLLFFWGVGCSHCVDAKPFVTNLPKEFPGLRVEWIEVRKNAEGRQRFLDEVRRLGIQGAGIPTFVYGQRYVVGFSSGVTETQVRGMLHRESSPTGTADGATSEVDSLVLPLIGRVRPGHLSMPVLTLTVGLVDGINPCAMWVLLVLLGILMHMRSRRRLLLVGGLFVLMSGIVYFMFMSAWVGLFAVTGISRVVTMGIGGVVLVMGLINLKELWAFKQGVSLTIPDRFKPHLFRRMRSVANTASWPAAILGVAVLAFLVNLVELGCTLGLPAVYTHILTLRGYSPAARSAYLVLYNVAYVVPLAVIVAVYALTLHRLTLSVRGAKLLKGLSGVILVSFGLTFIVWPELLG